MTLIKWIVISTEQSKHVFVVENYFEGMKKFNFDAFYFHQGKSSQWFLLSCLTVGRTHPHQGDQVIHFIRFGAFPSLMLSNTSASCFTHESNCIHMTNREASTLTFLSSSISEPGVLTPHVLPTTGGLSWTSPTWLHNIRLYDPLRIHFEILQRGDDVYGTFYLHFDFHSLKNM